MKALLVTSRVTFVPDNYDALVCGLALSSRIGGLIELDNAEPSLLLKSLGLMLVGAPRIGAHLFRNWAGGSSERRKKAYARVGKPFYRLKSMNTPEALSIVRDGGYDLIVNARTRCIYGNEILESTSLGCINVHHGLLPEQRGTMCDLWALYEGTRPGFSIHRMTPQIDAGEILVTHEFAGDLHGDYAAYLAHSARTELKVVAHCLDRIAETGKVQGKPNSAPAQLEHRRNPSRADIRKMRQKGLLL